MSSLLSLHSEVEGGKDSDGTGTKKTVDREATVIKVNSKAEIIDLKIRNMYESQVLASMGTITKGTRITNYYCCTDEPDLLKNILRDLRASVSDYASSLNYFEKLQKNLTLDRTQDFECDLYVNIAGDDNGSGEKMTVSHLLRSATSEIVPLNDYSPDNVDCTSKWLLVEISESPKLLAHKIFQLERAINLLPDAVDCFRAADIGACVVLLNGPREEAMKAIGYIQDLTKLKVSKYPLFVGWVPCRNFYAKMDEMSSDVSKLKADMSNMKTEMNRKMDRILLLLDPVKP